MLKRNNLKLQDFDFYEIHEAFAGQVLCTLKAWEDPEYCKKLGWDQALGSIDRSKLNIKGGSLALGHPFGATGGRIVAALAKMINQKGKWRGLISICTARGMGVVAIVEKQSPNKRLKFTVTHIFTRCGFLFSRAPILFRRPSGI